jgi:cytochrome c-type biogenesis protein CcmE
MQRNEPLSIPMELSGSRANKKVKFIIGGMAIVLAVIYLIYTGIQSTSAYFLTVDELHGRSDILSETGQRLSVVFNGPKPDQMREGAEAIIEGKFDGNQFAAQTLLLKCPSRYEEGTIEQIQVEAVR